MKDKDNAEGGAPLDEQEKHDIFTDPGIAQTIKEDPVLSFLVKWQRQISMLILAGVAIFFLVHYYRKTQLASLRRAADSFSGMRSELTRLLSDYEEDVAPKAEKDQEEKSDGDDSALPALGSEILESKLRLLSAEEYPYSLTSDVYRDLLRVKQGDREHIEAAVVKQQWKEIGSDRTAKRFLAELTALMYARSLLDDDKKSELGWEELKDLAKEGKYVAVTAALTLARIAASADQKSAVIRVMEEVMNSNPEQTALLEEEVEKLKL